MKTLITLSLLLLTTIAHAGMTIIPDAGDYTLSGNSVVLHEGAAPAKVVPVPTTPPVVVVPPVVTPPASDAPVVVTPTVTPTPTGKSIPGGDYPTALTISAAGEYVLQGDMTCAGTCIEVKIKGVTLDLNGKTITYNQTTPGEGINVNYHSHDLTIKNGSIIQGAAMSEGDVSGAGNNPIRSVGVERMKVVGINAKYGGRDVNGFHLKYVGATVENCTLEDTWNLGTPKNRHQGKSAINVGGKSVVRNNTIINARQAGITTGNDSEIYGNTVSINSMSTNSAGIGGYQAKNVKVHDNTITARGEHPIGIAYVSAGTDNIEIWNNSIDVQTTKLGEEYEGAGGNYAVGFRTTWGGNNINFHDNTILVRTDAAYQGTRSATGLPVVVNGKGRGLMVAINPSEKALFKNNKITVLDKTGTGKTWGIACTGNNDGQLVFEGNTVTSNVLNVALGDEYGYCSGYPLFIRNTFIRSGGDGSNYATVAAEMGGYFIGTGRFVDNIYIGGASKDSLRLNPNSKTLKSVFFGAVADTPAQTDLPFSDSGVKYEYELHNRNSTTTIKRLIP